MLKDVIGTELERGDLVGLFSKTYKHASVGICMGTLTKGGNVRVKEFRAHKEEKTTSFHFSKIIKLSDEKFEDWKNQPRFADGTCRDSNNQVVEFEEMLNSFLLEKEKISLNLQQ